MYSGDEYYGEEITSPLFRPQAPKMISVEEAWKRFFSVSVLYQGVKVLDMECLRGDNGDKYKLFLADGRKVSEHPVTLLTLA